MRDLLAAKRKVISAVGDLEPNDAAAILRAVADELDRPNLTSRCPCFYPDVDPESGTCACGHQPDEHDEDGQCQAQDVEQSTDFGSSS